MSNATSSVFAFATIALDEITSTPVCAIASTPFPKKLFNMAEEKFNIITVIKPFGLALLFVVCIAYMVDNSFSPFLYYIF